MLREKSQGEEGSAAEEGTFPDSTEYFSFCIIEKATKATTIYTEVDSAHTGAP